MNRQWWRRWPVIGLTLGAVVLMFVGVSAPVSYASHLVVFQDAIDGVT